MSSTFEYALSLVVLVAACDSPRPTVDPPGAPTPPVAAASSKAASNARALTRVEDVSKVCMVNDQYMGKDQIPTVVQGKAYFGCCSMCKEKLETQAAARTGTDPVSGNSVDKASAVIARDESGKVFYFESEGTLKRYAL